MTRYRSAAARDLVRAVQAAGGKVERTKPGKLCVTGPGGQVTVHEPSDDTRRDLRRSSVYKLIQERTGLEL